MCVPDSIVSLLPARNRCSPPPSTQSRSARGGSYRFLFLCALVIGAGALPACAATQIVTNTNDSGPGSLREAIAAASAGDTIQFGLTVTGTITLTSGELFINKDLTINWIGSGASLAVSGNYASRVFEISPGVTVALSGLTIENGPAFSGGGIYNNGTLTVTNSTISGNSAHSFGGGISNAGTLTVTNSTISGNSALGGSGLYNDSNGTLTVTNSTISGNSALGGGIYGGGIYNDGTLTLVNSTISGNSAFGLFNNNIFGTPVTVKSTLLASNGSGENCLLGALTDTTSQGYNLSDDNSCAAVFTAPGDQNNVVPGAGLDPQGLQNNFGLTQTIALLPTSPAVDQIPVANCTDLQGNPITTDQRGVARPQGTGCDVGAFELGENGPTGPFQIN